MSPSVWRRASTIRAAPDQVVHSLADMIGFRMKMIAAGYEDGNDANRLRADPVFKMAQDALPSGRDLASQSTICRLENLPGVRQLIAMGRAMVDLYCASFRQVPKRIVLDIDDTFDAVHGGQQLRLFNAHYDEYGFQPIVVFDGEGRFVGAVLRPAKRPGGAEIRGSPAPPGPGDPRQLAEHPDPDPRRQPLLRPAGDRLVPRQRRRLHPRRGTHHDPAPACRETWRPARRRASKRRRKRARSGASRSSSTAPPAGAASSASSPASRSAPQGADTRFIVTNLAGGKAESALRGCLLPARRGREPHQVLEDASRRRPHLLPPGRRPTSSGCSCTPAPTG